MFVDARELDDGHLVEADICIIGGGAVGIAMGLELGGTGVSVAIMESGGMAYDKRTQSLYRGAHVGRPTYSLETNRLRYFGGTTNHWAGHCRPFDAFDFSHRDWIPHSGWPLSIDELTPYLARSQSIMQLGEYDYSSLHDYATRLGFESLPLGGDSRLVSVLKHQSPPTRFGPAYEEELKRSGNVTVYLHSNVLELVPNAAASHVFAARVACIDGPRFRVEAKQYVLATGGLENPRLMLLSDSVAPNGLGNDRGLVGRFYTDHLLIRPAMDISLSRTDFDFSLYTKLHQINGGQIFAIMTPPAAITRRERMTRFRFHLYDRPPRYEESLGGVFSDLDDAPQPAPLAKEPGTYIQVHMAMEPIPNPDAFVRLSEERDLLGQRRLECNWVVTEQELANARRAIEIGALEFGRMGFGRAHAPILEEPERWPDAFTSGKHHCGTTRMADSPAHGVVDSDCRVFGIDNLFVTGSSVFPTIGHTNPTLNLIALSLRLANHLKGKLS